MLIALNRWSVGLAGIGLVVYIGVSMALYVWFYGTVLDWLHDRRILP